MARTLTQIENFFYAEGRLPTIRELGPLLGLSSPSSIKQRLDSLVRAGYLSRSNGLIGLVHWRGSDERL